MKTRRAPTLRRAAIALGVIGGGLLILWLALRGPERWTLPDGSQVTLQGVTFGTRHELVVGGPLARLQYHLHRVPALKRLGLPAPVVVRQNTANHAVTFWFHIQTVVSNAWPVYNAWVVEEDTRLASRGDVFQLMPLEPRQAVLSVSFENYPRRASHVLVRLNTWSQLAGRQSGHTNEVRATVRSWRLSAPSSEPAQSKHFLTNGLEIILERLVTGLGAIHGAGTERNDLHIHSLAQFAIRENGLPSTNWRPQTIQATNQSGNRFVAFGESQDAATDKTVLRFEESLWSASELWHVRCRFVRIGGFAPEELWTNQIADVGAAMSPRPAGTPLAVWRSPFGCDVRLLGLSPGSQPGSGTALNVRLDSAREDLVISVVRVTDDTGRPLSSRQTAFSRGTGFTFYSFELGPSMPVKSLTVVLAAHQKLEADFVVKSERAE